MDAMYDSLMRRGDWILPYYFIYLFIRNISRARTCLDLFKQKRQKRQQQRHDELA